MSLLKIGFSACFFHADDKRPIFKGKTLLYAEESMYEYIMEHGALPILLPRPNVNLSITTMVSMIDGLLLQGGSDVAPSSYNEKPLKPEWGGDVIRDEYEILLIKECMKQSKPILGICRGLQIMNVALGGSLYQDINEQASDFVHRDWNLYDNLEHEILFTPESSLQEWYGDSTGKIISIHHQAIKNLAPDFKVEAIAKPDSIIEAISLVSDNNFIYGVQWHPEFQKKERSDLLDSALIVEKFLEAVTDRRNHD